VLDFLALGEGDTAPATRGRNASEHWRLYQGASFGVGKRPPAARER
jgi:hypothetical protein